MVILSRIVLILKTVLLILQTAPNGIFNVTFAPVADREAGISRRFGLPGGGDFFQCLRIGDSIFILHVYCSHICTYYRKGARPMSSLDKISRRARAPYGRRQIIGHYRPIFRHRKVAGSFYHGDKSCRCPYDFFRT